MSYEERLKKAFYNAPILPLTNDSRYVLFSDCHRGSGTQNDNFLRNQHLYFAALQYYYQNNFTYLELGDGDELWENRHMEQIKEIHNNVFWMLSNFHKNGRLYSLYGNHDMVKKYPSFCKDKCSNFPCSRTQCNQPLFPNIQFHSGLILKNEKTGVTLHLTHGHQASLLNSTLWPITRFLVRYFWTPLEHLGIFDPTSAAKNYTEKQKTEHRLGLFALKNNYVLITGHTHRPMLNAKQSPHYINTGSCVHPRCITCIEICGEQILLIKWFVDTKPNSTLFVKREILTSEKLTHFSPTSRIR